MSDAAALKLINAARAHFGVRPLADFHETTLGGVEARQLFESQRDFLLGFYPWQFTRQIVQLDRLEDPPPHSGYAYQHQLPAQKLGPPERLHVSARDPDSVITAYAAIGDRIHCDHPVVFATIHVDVGPAGWPAAFYECARMALAADVAMSVASDRNAFLEYRRLAFGTPSENGKGGLMSLAIAQDGRTAPVRRIATGHNPMTAHYRGR